jgi:fatty-acyl-CoA synthase
MHIPLTPIRCLYRAADLYGRKEGVICGEKRFTYAQFVTRCERLAAALTAAGVRSGDRVAYLSFNTHKLLEGYYGVVLAGAIVMPLNVRLTPAELIQILNHSGAAMLLFESDFAPLIEAFRNYCPALTHYVALDGPHAKADLEYEEMLAQAAPQRVDIMTVDETTAAELFYTSGSTGSPKGVVLSHRTLYLQALQVAATFVKDDKGVELHTIPLFHANGWSRPQTCTMMGVKQVMIRRFDPALVFRLIEAERATSMSLVPVMAGALLQSPELGKHDYSSLIEIHVGGAASSPELIDRLEKAFGCPATAGYGLTETSPVATDARPKDTLTYKDDAERLYRQSMAGWPLPGTEVRVVDSEMRDVAQDMSAIGEIVIRGDNVMDGYYREAAATAAVMSGAWFHTGDMAVWDRENYVHIVDRRKDIIISGGENISSLEVEKAISAHPEVLECAVVAAPDEKWGEIPVAFVVHAPDHVLDEATLTAYLAGRLAKFKMPRAWRFTTEALPKTGTGKILKRDLREQFWTDKTKRVQG